MATLKDVAARAGVSLATAARVARGENNVSPKRKKLVEDAIRALNYEPNAVARQLRKNETGNVIVIIPDIKNSFFHEIIVGIEACALEKGYQVLLADMQNDPRAEEFYFRSLMQRQMDGIISLSASAGTRLMREVSSSYPVVFAAQSIADDSAPSISIDNIAAAKDMMQHLISLGYRNICHLTCQPTLALYRDRFTGYCQSLAENGIPIDMDLVRYGDSTMESGYESMVSILEEGRNVDAVFAAGDVIAAGAMQALGDRGLSIPGDVAVVGFDDIDIASYVRPRLTTIRQPRFAMGRKAMEMLADLMAGKALEDPIVRPPYELVIRESCP